MNESCEKCNNDMTLFDYENICTNCGYTDVVNVTFVDQFEDYSRVHIKSKKERYLFLKKFPLKDKHLNKIRNMIDKIKRKESARMKNSTLVFISIILLELQDDYQFYYDSFDFKKGVSKREDELIEFIHQDFIFL